jgi:hypothetical protein
MVSARKENDMNDLLIILDQCNVPKRQSGTCIKGRCILKTCKIYITLDDPRETLHGFPTLRVFEDVLNGLESFIGSSNEIYITSVSF